MMEDTKQLLKEGTDYLLGTNGCEVDKTKAMELFQEASTKGNVLATYNIACMYAFGDGVSQDSAKAIEYFILGSDQGDKEASYHAGELLYGEGRTEEGLKYLKLSCERKSLGGMLAYALAIMKQSTKEALDILFEASDLGNGNASLLLGDYFMEGKYLEQDFQKGFEYYLKAAKLRVNEAEAKVAECFRKGIGTVVDFNQADHYLKMSKIPYED